MFQKRVLEKYIDKLNKSDLEEKYIKFCSIFANKEKQENIKNSKEEQYQEGFLRDLFVSVLGYTINPEPNYNLITEQKNTSSNKDNRKSDGAIIFDEKVKAVIELKGTDTTDLNKIESQAFLYKEHNLGCKYVVISNFERLRFYIENAIEYKEFNLFNLSKDEFIILYLCLEVNQIKNDIPLLVKNETVSEEKEITDNFYNDYSVFKRNLFEDIYSNNPEYDKLLLFKKTQKLLDRILFIFFCEDRGLLPTNSVNTIIQQWEQLKNLDAYQPLYSRFQNYFNRINEGYKSPINSSENIFAYNGGLFKPDEILDKIKIGDDVLFLYTKRLSNYDFESQISVDILGHIFEHSLTEIEEVQNQLEAEKSGLVVEKTDIGKRKKDGVFYTPAYITKYIVENTIGNLCNKKKEELGIKDSDFSKQKKTSKDKDELAKKLDNYKEWLLSLKILDPACGSGAFLNSALKQLKIEHTLIDYYRAKIYGDTLIFQDVENEILEKNIFGVDINEESVEIAKLSLWLHTAQKNRKLTTLNNNIKCGNSLIDDPDVAGEKAFNWEKEFPEVFENGGFDVIIGNPPYVFAREKISENEKSFYTKNYVSSKYQVNTYILFIEQCQKLLKTNGLCGLIVPNSWLMVYSGEALRRYILENVSVNKIINLYGKSFADASVETVILLNERKIAEENQKIEIYINDDERKIFIKSHELNQIDFSKNKGCEFTIFKNDESSNLIEKIQKNCLGLDEVASVKAGLKAYEKGKGTPKQTAEDVKNRPYDYNYQFDDNTYKYLDGAGVLRYGMRWSGLWLRYGNHLAAPRTFDLFNGEKIIIREITSDYPKCINATYTENIYLFNLSNIAVIKRSDNFSLKYILTLLNSSLMSYYFKKNTAKAERKLFPKIILNDLRLFPIKNITLEEQNPFIELAEKILLLNNDLQKKSSKFVGRLRESLGVEKITSNLDNFYNFDFDDLIKELSKQKIKLSLKEKDEWEEYFNDYKTDISELIKQIEKTDKEINSLVYNLYELTPEEIEIIEKA